LGIFHVIEGEAFMKTIVIATTAFATAMMLSAMPASAGCVSKAAVATSGTADSAKWFALETMVQSVSWGLWPGFLANGKVEGYAVKNERYKCSPDGAQVTCHGQATFCATK
jgi:hypothetical protein